MTGWIGLTVAASVLGWPLSVAWAASQNVLFRSLDAPLAIRDVKPTSDSDPIGQITCTYYADLMVRETGTDTPDPAAAVLIPLARGRSRPACNARPIPGSILVKTEGYGLDGRKGRFLFWFASDPNGAAPFKVMDAGSGRILFEDGVSPAASRKGEARVQGGALGLRYARAFNASCSIMRDGRSCWAKLVAEGAVSRTVAPLDRVACKAAYKGVTADDPSVIVYDVAVVIDAAGRSWVSPRGPATCLAMP